MYASVNLLYKGQVYQCQPDETVLDALLRQQVPVPYSCKKQTCLSCMMRSLNGTPPVLSQRNLKETLQLQNNFLACACYPDRDMEIALAQDIAETQITAKVIEKNRLSDQIIELVLECESPLEFYGGQSVLLLNYLHIGKKLSIASAGSTKSKDRIELHVECLANNCFAKWVHEILMIDDEVFLGSVSGDMFYFSGQPNQALLLVAWGSNLAAMIGLMQDAFENNHSGEICLFHGVASKDQLYLQAELNEISDYFPNFHYIPCIEGDTALQNVQHYSTDEIVAKMLPNLTGWKVFVCGNWVQTHNIQRYAYLAGADMKDIYLEVMSIY